MTEPSELSAPIAKDDRWIALVGNPNCGKTAIFNQLTGLSQKVSNYPGVTVERKVGQARLGTDLQIKVLDLPGSYSIAPESFDERIVTEQVFDWIYDSKKPDVIISVVDATNLSRNLFLTSQMLDLEIPVIIALNMMDRVKRKHQKINIELLKDKLGAADIIPMSATEKWGVKELRDSIRRQIEHPTPSTPELPFRIIGSVNEVLSPLAASFEKDFKSTPRLAWSQALRIVAHEPVFDIFVQKVSAMQLGTPEKIKDYQNLRQKIIARLKSLGINAQTLEASYRYGWLDILLADGESLVIDNIDDPSRSERVDKVLTHPVFGPIIFLGILYFIFHSIFSWATLPMNLIDSGVHAVGDFIITNMPAGILKDLIVEGIVGGVGAILIFLPQILILVFFLTLLEDSGYMSRVAFMLDRYMTKVGLHGRSMLPLMTGYACAIPGIMATRTIESWKERLITILILPLMSCSARLPVYTLLIAAFIPAKTVFGFVDLQGFTLVLMYFLGTVTALLLAVVFDKFIKLESTSSFIMEMPPYRVPMMLSVTRQVYNRGKAFLLNAGKIIMTMSIVLWFLVYFPRPESNLNNTSHIENSYAGKVGRLIEPVISPLGFDWKIGVGLLTSFAAREVMVSTLATIYNVEGRGEGVISVSEALRSDTDPETGLPRYGILMAISLMVYYVFAAQCMATFAIVREETNSWKWPLFMVFYMTSLAYLSSLIVYQGGRLLGFS
ncbi:MAG: ferrous iron transport protein B [FCB group bacterium]|nr:ferrous iron transport protein B [FCB group bacterium]